MKSLEKTKGGVVKYVKITKQKQPGKTEVVQDTSITREYIICFGLSSDPESVNPSFSPFLLFHFIHSTIYHHSGYLFHFVSFLILLNPTPLQLLQFISSVHCKLISGLLVFPYSYYRCLSFKTLPLCSTFQSSSLVRTLKTRFGTSPSDPELLFFSLPLVHPHHSLVQPGTTGVTPYDRK